MNTALPLGAMAHYAADNNGHRIGTNRAVPLLYPKLKKKYGDSVTYEQGQARATRRRNLVSMCYSGKRAIRA